MKLQNLSVRAFLRKIVAGTLLTAALLLLIFFLLTKDVRVVICGIILTAAFYIWGMVFLHYFQKKLSLFTDGLCQTLDHMMDSTDRPQVDYEAETLLSRISHRLERLYNVMQKTRHMAEGEKEELQSLVSDISHQTKTPIANLKLINDTMLTRPLTEEKRKEFLQATGTQLDKLDFLIQGMVKTSRLETGVITLENNDVMSNSTKVLHRSLSAKNLAFLNFARNRKKTALTILSLGVCGILLMASSAYFNSIDPLAMARRSFPYGEIRLELGDYGPQAHNSEQYSELQKSNLLTEDFRESILDIDGVEEIKEYQGTVLNVRMPTGDIEPIVSDAYTPSSQKLLEQYLIDGTADLQELLNNNGIIIENGPQWKETFGWDAAIGDELLIEVGGQTLEVKVMGIVDANIPYGGYDTLFIPLEMLSKIVPIDNLNYQFIVDTDDSKWAAAKDEIQKIIPPTSSLYVSTLNDWVEAYNEKLLNYRMPVYIFIMFIGVFGIINLLNTLITNILTRKRELGVLQAVGLSSKQLSKMLLIEGLFYTLGVLLLSISCGTLIGYLLCTVFSAMSIFGKVSYHFPTVEMFSYFILMLAVQMLFSCFAIRQIKKQSLVDQIRELS